MKAVIFDMGGVLACDVWENLLLDERDGVAFKYPPDPDLVKKVGTLLWAAFAYRPETRYNDWRSLERQYWKLFIDFFDGQLHSDLSIDSLIHKTQDFIKPVNGSCMDKILERLLSRGVNLAICSNNTEFWFRRQMDSLNLHRFFSPNKVVLSCRVGVSKSSPGFEMFHEVADTLATIKSECVFIDDRKPNVERAKECGMVGIKFKDTRQLDNCLKAQGL